MIMALDRDLPWHRLVLKYCFWAALGAALATGIYFAGLPIVGGIGLGIIGLGAISGIGFALSLDGFTSVTTSTTDTNTPVSNKQRLLSFTKITLGLCSMLPILWFTGCITTLPALLTAVALAATLPLCGFLNNAAQANGIRPNHLQKPECAVVPLPSAQKVECAILTFDESTDCSPALAGQEKRLQEQVETLTSQVRERDQSLKESRADAVALESQESRLHEEYDIKITELEAQIEGLTSKLSATTQQLLARDTEVKHATEENSGLCQENAALGEKIASLTEQLRAAIEALDLEAETYDEYKGINELQEAEIAKLHQTVADLEQKVVDLEANLDSETCREPTPSPSKPTRKSVDQAPRPITPTTPFFTHIRAKHAQQRNQHLSSENDTLSDENRQLGAQVIELQSALSDLQEAIEAILSEEQRAQLATLIEQRQTHVSPPTTTRFTAT